MIHIYLERHINIPGFEGVDETIFEPRKATKSVFDFSIPLIICSIRLWKRKYFLPRNFNFRIFIRVFELIITWISSIFILRLVKFALAVSAFVNKFVIFRFISLVLLKSLKMCLYQWIRFLCPSATYKIARGSDGPGKFRMETIEYSIIGHNS